MTTLLENLDFVKGIALYGNQPDPSNDIIKAVLAEWQTIKQSDINYSCGNCDNGYLTNVKEYYQYYLDNQNNTAKTTKTKK